MLETTFVFIKQLTTIDGTICVIHFNTTYVFIKLTVRTKKSLTKTDFNTTSVFIKRLIKIFIQHQEGISIQLLFLLNVYNEPDFSVTLTDFNTTSVFIKHKKAIKRCFKWHYFNTTSVFIKLNVKFQIRQGVLFQYNFCSY